VHDRSDYLEELMHRSMQRVTCSQSSLDMANELLERTRRTIEDSVKLLSQSHLLVREPFRRSWQRAEEQDLTGSQNLDQAFTERETGSDRL